MHRIGTRQHYCIWLSWRDIFLLLIGGTVGVGEDIQIRLWTREKRP